MPVLINLRFGAARLAAVFLFAAVFFFAAMEPPVCRTATCARDRRFRSEAHPEPSLSQGLLCFTWRPRFTWAATGRRSPRSRLNPEKRMSGPSDFLKEAARLRHMAH